MLGQNLEDKKFQYLKTQLTKDSDLEKVTPFSVTNYKAPGDVIWSEDFTGGFPSGWSVYDSTGNGFNWVLDPGTTNITAEFTNATPIASNSGGNHMLLFGDQYNQPAASGTIDMNAYFQTAAIPLTGQPFINVNFQQKFRRCCNTTNGQANLLVSTDPTFTTNVSSYDLIGGVPQAVASPNPMNMSINISNIAGGVNGNIYLRFHISSGISHYFWMIDDIELVESIRNDIVATNGFYGFNGYQYTRIPYTQIQPMDVSMIAENIGSANQTGTHLTLDINDGVSSVFNTNTNNTILNSLSIDTFEILNVWTPSGNIGDWGKPYSVTLSIASDSTDTTPSNNEITFPPFEVNESVMALDDYSANPGNGGGNPGPNGVTEYEAGNQFFIPTSQNMTSIDIVTGPNTPIGTFIDVVLYQIDFTTTPVSYNEKWRSTPSAITAGDIGIARNFSICGAIGSLVPGTYFAAVHSFVDYEYGTSGTNPGAGTPAAQHSAIRYPNMTTPNANSSFGLTNTPMIRLRFDICGAINDESKTLNSSIHPNPSKGEFNITFDTRETETAALVVKNVIGQTIINKTINSIGQTTAKINLSNYDKGIYFLTITTPKGAETTKLILE
ncbi:MAG: T9SS type A sorting domain-containing protein [Flavobacteriales bacterium]|nr:T9SS type A sorting domain-containing protein [Flavobacteriales bacterium]